ncbi:MAG: hypothetical protein BZ137_09760, partial [Methanosphaera sp. rholeuAM130]
MNNGVKRGISEETININKNIVIDANGMNINANMGNVFKISNADVTIKNVVINNSYGLVGSVLDASQSNVIFENLTLFDNEVYNFGSSILGSIMNIDSSSTLIIRDSLIENNTGTIVATASNLTIDNSILRNNPMINDSLGYISGWIRLNGGLTITNSLIE